MLVWIHDFPLVLLPALLRKRVPDSLIGFYLHSVFPSSEIFRNLSKRKEILEALLDASLIGFQVTTRLGNTCYDNIYVGLFLHETFLKFLFQNIRR